MLDIANHRGFLNTLPHCKFSVRSKSDAQSKQMNARLFMSPHLFCTQQQQVLQAVLVAVGDCPCYPVSHEPLHDTKNMSCGLQFI